MTLDEGRTARSFHYAVATDRIGDVLDMLNDGMDVNCASPEKHTALHLAANRNNIRMLSLLIERGANVNARDKHGETPLHWAADSNAEEAAMLLIEHGANERTPNRKGRKAFDIAKKLNFRGMMKILGREERDRENIVRHKKDIERLERLCRQRPRRR